MRTQEQFASDYSAIEAAQQNEIDSMSMGDTPKGLLEELRSSVLKKRVGQIALAVVLAEAVWRLVRTLTWYFIIPIIGRFLHGNTESVLFEKATNDPIRWDWIFGSLLEFVLVVIVVLYLNRWIQREPSWATIDEPGIENEPVVEETGTAEDDDQGQRAFV